MSRQETLYDVVRMVFPTATDKECSSLLWEHTGYPCFWRTATARQSIINSLRWYRRALRRGTPVCEMCDRTATYPKRAPNLCGRCGRALSGHRRGGK